MNLIFITFVMCSFFGASVAGIYDESDGGYKDIWKAITESDKYFVIKRNYSQGRLECEFMRVVGKDIKNRRLNAVFGYRNATAKRYNLQTMQVTTSKYGMVPFDNKMTIRKPKSSADLANYILMYYNDGCLVLRTWDWQHPNRMSHISHDAYCEMWTVATKAERVPMACDGFYKSLCDDPVSQKVYKRYCQIIS
ncbi:uncharacterized protein LOC135383014 [Ornithodoros turicata]|uniref:Putative salivary secreted lipocalin n=1 Tax=Ornithodoros turicata TaxID=34597 RepID=A0A2R5LJA5_9ACAR